MPDDAESFLGIDPKRSGSSPWLPSSLTPLETRRTWLSLAAFALGLAGVITGVILEVSGISYMHFPVWDIMGRPIAVPKVAQLLLLLSLGFNLAGVGYLTASIVCGLRVVKNNPDVLWWVFPASIIALLDVGFPLMAAVSIFSSPGYTLL